MRSSKSGVSDGDRRPIGYWATFNNWWRNVLSEQGCRPTQSELAEWFALHAAFCWQHDEMPTLKEVRTHAKCLRSTEQVRNYFRKYRAARRANSTSMRTSASDSDSDDATGDCAPTIQSGLVGCAGHSGSAAKPSRSVGTGEATGFVPFVFGAAGPNAGFFFSAGSPAGGGLGAADIGLLQGCGPASGKLGEPPAFQTAYTAHNPLQPTTSGVVSGAATRATGKRTPYTKYATRTLPGSSLGLPPRQPGTAATRPPHLPPAAAAVSGPVISFSHAGQPQHSAHGSGAACSIGGGIVLQLPPLQRTGSASTRLQITPTKHFSPAPTAPPAKRTSLRPGYSAPSEVYLQPSHPGQGPAALLRVGGPSGGCARPGTAAMPLLMAGGTSLLYPGAPLGHNQQHIARGSSVPSTDPLIAADLAAMRSEPLLGFGEPAPAADGVTLPGDDLEGDGAAVSPTLAFFRAWQRQEMDDLLDDLCPMSPGLLAAAARMDASSAGRSAQMAMGCDAGAGGLLKHGQAPPMVSAWMGQDAQWAPTQQLSAAPYPYPGAVATVTNSPHSWLARGTGPPNPGLPPSLAPTAGGSGGSAKDTHPRVRVKAEPGAASPNAATGVQVSEQQPQLAEAAGMLQIPDEYDVGPPGVYPPPHAHTQLGPGNNYAFHPHHMPPTDADGSSIPMPAPPGAPYSAYPYAAHASSYAPYGYGPLPPGYPSHSHHPYYYHPQLPPGGGNGYDMYSWPSYPHPQHQAMPSHAPYPGMMYGGGGYPGYLPYPPYTMGDGGPTDGAMVNTGPPEASSTHVRAVAASARRSGGSGEERPSAMVTAACAAEPLMPGRYVWQATAVAGGAHKGLAAGGGGSGDDVSRLAERARTAVVQGSYCSRGRACYSQSVSVAQAAAADAAPGETEECIESVSGGSMAAPSAAASPAKMLPPPPRQPPAHGSTIQRTTIGTADAETAVVNQERPTCLQEPPLPPKANILPAILHQADDLDRQPCKEDGDGHDADLLDLSIITAGLFSPASSNAPAASGDNRGCTAAGVVQTSSAVGFAATPRTVAAAAAGAASSFAFTPVQACAGNRSNPFAAHMTSAMASVDRVPAVRHPDSSCAFKRQQELLLPMLTTAGGGSGRHQGQTPRAGRREVLQAGQQQFASGPAATPGSAVAAFGIGGSPFDSSLLASWLTSPTSMVAFDTCARLGLEPGDAGGIAGVGKSWEVDSEVQLSQPADATAAAGADVHCASDLTAHIQITYTTKAAACTGAPGVDGGNAARASSCDNVRRDVLAAWELQPLGKGVPLVEGATMPSTLTLAL